MRNVKVDFDVGVMKLPDDEAEVLPDDALVVSGGIENERDEARFGSADFNDVSPILKQARAEIEALLDRHGIGGAIHLAGSTGAEFWLQFPKWCAIQLTEEGARIKSSSERDGSQHLESSLLQNLVDRDPVDARRFHRDGLDPRGLKPIRESVKVSGETLE